MRFTEFTEVASKLVTPEVIANYHATSEKYLFVAYLLADNDLPDRPRHVEYLEDLIDPRIDHE